MIDVTLNPHNYIADTMVFRHHGAPDRLGGATAPSSRICTQLPFALPRFPSRAKWHILQQGGGSLHIKLVLKFPQCGIRFLWLQAPEWTSPPSIRPSVPCCGRISFLCPFLFSLCGLDELWHQKCISRQSRENVVANLDGAPAVHLGRQSKSALTPALRLAHVVIVQRHLEEVLLRRWRQ